jgi:hypothetical protein
MRAATGQVRAYAICVRACWRTTRLILRQRVPWRAASQAMRAFRFSVILLLSADFRLLHDSASISVFIFADFLHATPSFFRLMFFIAASIFH